MKYKNLLIISILLIQAFYSYGKNNPGKNSLIEIENSNVKLSINGKNKSIEIVNIDSPETKYKINGFGSSVILDDINKINKNKAELKFKYNNTDIKSIIEINNNGRIIISLEGKGKLNSDIEFPGSLTSTKNESWVLPMNEGMLIPCNDHTFSYKNWWGTLYAGHGGLSMPFIGLTNGDSGLIVICSTPDDVKINFKKAGINKTSSISFLWHPSTGEWRYKRELYIELVPAGGYTGIAKKYRNYAKESGKFVTLKEKRKTTPEIDKLIGAVNLWWWKKAEWWERDKDCKNIVKQLKDAGIDKVLWSNQAPADDIKYINSQGYLPGRYDIYQDVWAPDVPIDWVNTKGWPEDLILLPDGTWKKGWVAYDGNKPYPGGIVCSIRGYERMKKEVNEDLKTNPYKARFIDTTTASPLYECYNPDHPASRTDDRYYKSKLLEYLIKDKKLITGSETGIDWAVPYVHYFEGMMSLAVFRLPNAGYDLTAYIKPGKEYLKYQAGYYYRIPLFELVYHDCIVSSWYWGDSSNRIPELWDRKDLLNLLYGTVPLWICDYETWEKYKARFIQSYNTAAYVSGITGYAEMTDHKFLTDDHSVQFTSFSNGVKVWVNFGNKKYVLNNNTILKPGEYFLQE